MSEEAPANRPETGAMRFGSDWTGAFIRGDDAFGYALALEVLIKGDPDDASIAISRMVLAGLLEVLKSSDENRNPQSSRQQLIAFNRCLPEFK